MRVTTHYTTHRELSPKGQYTLIIAKAKVKAKFFFDVSVNVTFYFKKKTIRVSPKLRLHKFVKLAKLAEISTTDQNFDGS